MCFVRDKKKVVLRPVIVHDLSEIQVFEGVTNRTAVFVCEKQYEGVLLSYSLCCVVRCVKYRAR